MRSTTVQLLYYFTTATSGCRRLEISDSGPTAPTIPIYKCRFRLTPIPNARVDLYLKVSMVGAIDNWYQFNVRNSDKSRRCYMCFS